MTLNNYDLFFNMNFKSLNVVSYLIKDHAI